MIKFSRKRNNIFELISKNFSYKFSVPLPMKDLGLEQHDPELYNIIEKEKYRQWAGIELIASENYTSRAVMDCLGKF